MMLARTTAREREMAVRLAIGAGRWRLIRLVLGESLLLSIAGAVAGAALAQGLSRALLNYLNTSFDFWTGDSLPFCLESPCSHVCSLVWLRRCAHPVRLRVQR
jgi:ABC-type antimicrobial peptide transport system permease subunit